MNNYQKVKQNIIFILKGLPIVAFFFISAMIVARQIVLYSPVKYQAVAKIKLDDNRYGYSGNNLYSDFDVFTSENKIEGEVEVIQSTLIISKVLDSLNLNPFLYRKGRIKNTLLYKDSPIEVDVEINNDEHYDYPFELEVLSKSKFEIRCGSEDSKSYHGEFDTPLEIDGSFFIVRVNRGLKRFEEVQFEGSYELVYKSRDALISHVKEGLNVKAIDKEVAVVRVVYQDENPTQVAEITNAICKVYIEDYVSSKTSAANKTLKFIDRKLNQVGKQLEQAESRIEEFKIEKSVVNTLQETETGLREISKLQVQLFNLEMEESAVNELNSYLNKGDYFEETAVNFGFGDLLMTELVKRMKLWQDKRRDLLIKYTVDHDKVKAVDEKIEEVKVYIKEAIAQNLKDIEIKRAEINAVVEKEKKRFDGLPTREKNQKILERQFHILEDVYNFLSQKRIEASIASTANMSFHRIIQPATIPIDPVSPNKTLIYFIFGFLGFGLGFTAIFLRKMILGRINSKNDIEKNSMIQISNVIRKNNKGQDFEMLVKGLFIKSLLQKDQIVGVNSSSRGEGKTYVSFYVANEMKKLGFNVCVMSNDRDHDIKTIPFIKGQTEVTNDGIYQVDLPPSLINVDIEKLKSNFDFIVIDSKSTIESILGVEVMKIADLNLYVIRSNQTSTKSLSFPFQLQEEYGLDNIYFILNYVHKATNYTGNFISSSFYGNKPKNPIKLIRYYWKAYRSK